MYAEGYLCFSTLEKWPSQAVARCVWAVLSPSISRGPGTPRPRAGSDLCSWTSVPQDAES